jgi:hypothetical protein
MGLYAILAYYGLEDHHRKEVKDCLQQSRQTVKISDYDRAWWFDFYMKQVAWEIGAETMSAKEFYRNAYGRN